MYGTSQMQTATKCSNDVIVDLHTLQETEEAIKKRTSKMYPGPDGINEELVKTGGLFTSFYIITSIQYLPIRAKIP